MRQFNTVFMILLVAWMVSSCGIARRSAYPPGKGSSSDSDHSSPVSRQPDTAMSVVGNETKSSLMQAYHEWEGTPYRLGGASKEGVDCSRFINIVFDDYFGIRLPAHTRAQMNAGEGIRRSAIRAGDLVFFRTGRKTLHVGVAVNHGEFMHASSSSGVMISKLGTRYWRHRFLSARRIL